MASPLSTENLTSLDEALSMIAFCDDSKGKTVGANGGAVDDMLSWDEIGDFLDTAVENLTPSNLVLNGQLTDSTSHDAMMPPPKKKRACRGMSSSTAIYRRKNTEIQSLREQAVELEALLAQLKGSEVGGQSALAFTESRAENQRAKWHSEAVTRYQERSEAEKTNRQLKKILQQCDITSKKLGTILNGRQLDYAMEYLRTGESPCVLDALLDLDYTSRLRAQLESEVESLYRDFHNLYQPHDQSMVYSAVLPRYDEQHKSTCMEFVTTTPMECPMETAHHSTWTYLKNTSDPTWKHNTLEKKVNTTLSHSKGSYEFGKLHFLRKFEEKDRVVIIWSDILLLPSKRLQVRTFAYSVIERSRTDPMHASVKHTWLKLQADFIDGNRPTEVMKQTQESVLGAMSREMRKYWNYEQNR
ncbi:hypothetical protein PHYBOEH_010391, partial [Phytophthora boehmeriae]